MRKIIILICILIPLGIFGKDATTEILDRDDDIESSNFSDRIEGLNPNYAIELLEKQAKTILKTVGNEILAAIPYTGNAGVAMEVGASNLKLDELIVTNKNYNYQMTSILGNILKVTKEARDGRIGNRAKNQAKKLKLISESLKLIKKCEKTKRTLNALSSKGWGTDNMLRAVNSIDITLKSLEIVGEILLENYNTISEENKKLDELTLELKQINKVIESTYADTLKDLNEKIRAKYTFEYNSSLLNGAMYFQDMTKDEGQKKYEKGMKNSKNALVAFKNIMWTIFGIFCLISVVSIIFKVTIEGQSSSMGGFDLVIVQYMNAWFVGVATALLMASILEYIIPIIY